jgi:uncharacterized protein (TIGR02217 family)
MSSFHEVLFPVDISYGSAGGPKWKTSIFTAASGFEGRAIEWGETRAEYDISYGIKSQEQMDLLTTFFYARRGRAYGFRFKDWNDYQATDLFLGVGDYATFDRQLVKTYSSPGFEGTPFTYDRALKKIEWGSEIGVKINGLAITRNTTDPQYFAIDYNTGVLSTGVPMKGGFYHDDTPYTPITFLVGGTSTGYGSADFLTGGCVYDHTTHTAYLLGSWSGSTAGGVRKIDVSLSKETAQATANQMNLPVLGVAPYASNVISGIIAAYNGYFYVALGGTLNGNALAKCDGTTLQFITSFGAPNGAGPSANASSFPVAAGCVSLDGATLLHMGFWGAADLHRTDTMARITNVLQVGGPGNSRYVGACPYRQAGFGIPLNWSADPDNACSLVLYLGHGVHYEAVTFGGLNGRVYGAYYDQLTGGVVVMWDEAGAASIDRTQMWAGLYHQDVEGFVWKRRMPEVIGFKDLSQLNMQTPVYGQLCWVHSAWFFGSHLWLLNTQNGELRARRMLEEDPFHITGGEQAFDPDLKVVIAHSSSLNSDAARVISTDTAGVTMDPPQTLTVDGVNFHVPVRFDTDFLNAKHEFWNTLSWDQIPLVETRDWDNDVEIF